MALKYTSVTGFATDLGLLKRVPSIINGVSSDEQVGQGTAANTTYYLDQLGVISSTITLLANDVAMTQTTDYTFDSDSSLITLTAAGVTSASGKSLTARYQYLQGDGTLTENYVTTLLTRMEYEVEKMTDTVFADQTAVNPVYDAQVDEYHPGKGYTDDLYNTNQYPLVKLSTTVAQNYSGSGTSLVVTSSSGFPASGYLSIDGGYKVYYSAKSGNTLTVTPITASTISGGTAVRGEVVEVCTSPGGTTPVWTVLTGDTQYNIDYDTGQVQLLNNWYVQDIWGLSLPPDGISNRFRASYQQAYHYPSQDCAIPTEVPQVIYNLAAHELSLKAVLKSNFSQANNFNPTALRQMLEDIMARVKEYKSMRVGRA